MSILVINCGSSSAKYQLFEVMKRRPLALRHCSAPMVSNVEPLARQHCSAPMVSNVEPLATGVIERIGHNGSILLHQKDDSSTEKKVSCKNHYAAIKLIVAILTDPRRGVIKSKDAIRGIGHRVVHGGERFKESALITRQVAESIRGYSELAPLHNPPSLSGINACAEILKGIPQVAVFDTAFHQTMPARSFLYGLPFKYYKKYGIRKYGFHGTSHRYVAEEAARRLKKPLKSLKLITCHLGNGCSMAAVDGGESIDTSMGFTPLEGLIMGTRSGDLDPAAVLYIMEKENLSFNSANDVLNKESGLLGISGVSNDMRDIVKASKSRSAEASSLKSRKARGSRLAIDMFVYRIEKYIGSYMAAMNGLDAIVFTAGISEHNPWLIKRIAGDLKNIIPGKTKLFVIPTNEELLIAEETYRIIKNFK